MRDAAIDFGLWITRLSDVLPQIQLMCMAQIHRDVGRATWFMTRATSPETCKNQNGEHFKPSRYWNRVHCCQLLCIVRDHCILNAYPAAKR